MWLQRFGHFVIVQRRIHRATAIAVAIVSLKKIEVQNGVGQLPVLKHAQIILTNVSFFVECVHAIADSVLTATHVRVVVAYVIAVHVEDFAFFVAVVSAAIIAVAIRVVA